ncbi:MAG: DUF4416 family protein [Thermodesulfobacteriota bacterium]
MSVLKEPEPAKLITSLFMKDTTLLADIFSLLEEKFGRADMVSRWFDFDFTSYYHREMGTPLFRRMVVFEPLVGQADLAGIKQECMRMETLYQRGENRRINIDPGYLVPSRFILATGKDYAHRICIGKHVYADLTLIYKKHDFAPLEWTYPDYADRRMRDFLLKVRAKYLMDKKRSTPENFYD